MSEEKASGGHQLLFFVLGAAVGAAAVALLTPKSGPELRAAMKEKVRAFKAALDGERDEA
jgi:gas vesicle protein